MNILGVLAFVLPLIILAFLVLQIVEGHRLLKEQDRLLAEQDELIETLAAQRKKLAELRRQRIDGRRA